MIKRFNHLQLPHTAPIQRITSKHGQRVYVVEGEQFEYPSITTVLSHYDNQQIDDWKLKVGSDEAKRVSNIASVTGTFIHKACENYLNNLDDPFSVLDSQLVKKGYTPSTIPPGIRTRFEKFIPTLNRINNIYAQEHIMCTDWYGGIAGTVDCIAEFDGKLSIIDFKTSKKWKKHEWIKKYFVQETAYTIMFYKMYGIKVDQLVTLISVDGYDDAQVFIEHPSDHIEYLKLAMDNYRSLHHG